MKFKHSALLIIGILAIDQIIKIYVKTHFAYGETVDFVGQWWKTSFIENAGMAYGIKLDNSSIGKVILTIFRLVAVIVGFFWINKLSKKGLSKIGMICGSLILAGAAGNLIDSMFYGLIFDKGLAYDAGIGDFVSYSGVAHFSNHGYAPFLHGCVVDMFSFPIIDTTLPNWLPIWGGNRFQFFEPIFNFADASISIGVALLIIFQKKIMPVAINKDHKEKNKQNAFDAHKTTLVENV